MTKNKGIKAADALMKKLVQVPKSEMAEPKRPDKKAKVDKKKKK